MKLTINWTTITLSLTDMEPILGTAEGNVFGSVLNGQMIRPDRAEVNITDGVVSNVTIRGDILTKSGAVSKRHTYQGLAVGHTELEAEIGALALAGLKGQI